MFEEENPFWEKAPNKNRFYDMIAFQLDLNVMSLFYCYLCLGQIDCFTTSFRVHSSLFFGSKFREKCAPFLLSRISRFLSMK
jgi:hypothetical protein